jgi:hypothetical protein
LFLALALSISAAHADAPSLKDNMKQIRTHVKALGANVGDASKNVQSAADAKALIELFAAAESQIPDSITALPAAEQAAAVADYKSLIQHEIDLATALEKAFEANDNASAAKILGQMDDTKKEGHQKYNDN